LFLIFQAATLPAAAPDAPVVLLIQATGEVAYSTGGKQWKPIRRNKFLYRGYTLRTGADGRCKLLDQETDEIRTVENNTVVKIDEKGLKVLKGRISEASPAGGLAGFLERKFARVQKYTAVRRSANPRTPRQLKTARQITLSPDYPDLVWESWGPLYSYELTVGEKRFEVPPSKEDVIRFTLTAMTPGVFPYGVKVLYQGEVLQRQKQDGELRWLSDEDAQAFNRRKMHIEELAREDGFLLGNLMDDEGFKVAAMDAYRRFMAENPEANEVRPFLIKVLSDLHLDRLRQRESVRYHQLKGLEK
jgi:hypothetical protein